MDVTSINDMTGICAAHWTDEVGGTGCTVIVCPHGAVGAVDVRGGAPATRETDLLRPEETVGCLHAVVLSGGSAFGLAAASGVMDELERADIGLDVGVAKVPIVASACLFDLMCGDAKARPGYDAGVQAARAALAADGHALASGNVGAGTGCTVGKLGGPTRAMKTGVGQGTAHAGGLVCYAISAVNAVGDVYDPSTQQPIAGLLDEEDRHIVGSVDALLAQNAEMPLPRTNTTISCIVTNARLTKAQATKVAQMSADAYAHTIRPTHTTNDGDTIFVMATGEVDAEVDVVGILATSALERAIVDGALSARSAYGYTAACEL